MRLTLLLVPVLVLGCAAQPNTDPTTPVAQTTTDQPLPLDPTHEVVVGEWWSNGSDLLQLEADGFYQLYPDVNRYRKPIERGKWWRQSYASVSLEPYAELPAATVRATLRRDNGAVVMNVGRFGEMRPLPAPPPVIEDRLFGRWIGGAGSLLLGVDLRYRFAPKNSERFGPASITSQVGAWAVEDDMIVLRPDSSAIAPTLVRVVDGTDGGTITLELADGRLVRSPEIAQDG